YSSQISWRADAPVAADADPARAFDRLFDRRLRGESGSVLDRVRDRASRLARQVSASDRARLDGYLTTLREVEPRVDRDRHVGTPDLRDRLRLMCDIVALAFQSDTTRIASLILARDLSPLSYPFLGVGADHHAASHEDLSDEYERIVRFHVGW